MLMCLCYGISCHEIKKMVQEGVVTTEGIQKKCHAGTGCGCCLEALKVMVEIEANKIEETAMSTSHVTVGRGNSRGQCP